MACTEFYAPLAIRSTLPPRKRLGTRRMSQPLNGPGVLQSLTNKIFCLKLSGNISIDHQLHMGFIIAGRVNA